MNVINKIVNTGVREDFAFPQKRKIILLNYLCLISSVIFLVYMPVNAILGLPAFFYIINLIGQSIVWFCIWLNYKGKYGHARVFANLFLLLFINAFCLFTGEGTGAEYINLVLFILPLVIFDNKKFIAIFSGAAFLLFVVCKIVFEKYEALYDHHNSDALFFWIGTSVVFFSTFYLLSRFKNEVVTYSSLIEKQHNLLAEQNKEIKASMRYAQLIQRAIFYNTTELKKSIPNSFAILSPYNLISGDFCWFSKIENKSFLAVADCTGHGVPAALMTIVGHNLFNEALNANPKSTAGELLSYVNKALLMKLKEKTGTDISLNDGMDACLCVFDFEQKTMQYSGANRPLFVVRKGELAEYSPTKSSLGGHTKAEQRFSDEVISLVDGDSIYMFTDGCTDQFGGPKGKKFSKKRLKELLVSFEDNLSSNDRVQRIKEAFMAWQGSYTKTDDSFIVGIIV